jgi:hypothetical protein
MYRKFLIILMCFCAFLTEGAKAQDESGEQCPKASLCAIQQPQPPQQPRFSPQAFKEQIHAYIAKAADMTAREAALYFPLYDEMHEKQRAIHDRINELCRDADHKYSTDAKYAQALNEIDRLKIQDEKLEVIYHRKMMKVVPARKVFTAIGAESMFHRRMLKSMSEWRGGVPAWQQPKQ